MWDERNSQGTGRSMATRRTELSDTELEVLKALWGLGQGTVRDLHERLEHDGRNWAYTTVLTFVGRLESKGYVASDKSGVAHIFRPIVSRDALLRQRLTHLAADLCEGTSTPLVHALVEGQQFSPEEIARFRELLDRLESHPPTNQKRPRSPGKFGRGTARDVSDD